MGVFIKIYKSAGDYLVAACDENTLGKKFSFNDITFEVKESFYRGEKITLEEIKPFLEKATILNLVGTQIIGKCMEWGYIVEENILDLGETIHAQMVKV